MDEYTYVGKIKVESGKLLVSDPCYLPEPDGSGGALHASYVVEGIPSGEHECFVTVWDDRKTHGWGRRVAELRVDCKGAQSYGIHESRVANVGVDSGQMSFMDEALIPEWGGDPRTGGFAPENHVGEFNYQGACNASTPDNGSAGFGTIDNRMVISCTGYGDGGYEVFVGKDQNDCVSYVRVVFLEEYDDDSEYF